MSEKKLAARNPSVMAAQIQQYGLGK